MRIKEAMQTKKSRGFVSFRGRSSLKSKAVNEESGINTVNVLSTTTEVSMSSTSFAIPRRSTIDADVNYNFSIEDYLLFKHIYFFIG